MKSLTGEDGQATGLATAHVNKGDDVYIQTHHQDPGSGAIYGVTFMEDLPSQDGNCTENHKCFKKT